MKLSDAAKSVGIGSLVIGHRQLAKEPLTEDDWAEVHRAYLAFQHHVRLIVIQARKRAEKG